MVITACYHGNRAGTSLAHLNIPIATLMCSPLYVLYVFSFEMHTLCLFLFYITELKK